MFLPRMHHHSLTARGIAAAALLIAAPLALPSASATTPTAWTTASAAPLADAPDTAFRSPAAPRDTILAVSSSEAEAADATRLDALSSLLREEAPRWIGIPYRWGGTTRRGIDCSSFVQQYVRATMDISLPRTTATQRYEGVHVAKADLVPGDLVFFRRRGTRHVGVYLGDGDFIHASSSRGVTISKMSNSYWRRHYWMSRRVLPEVSDARPTPRSEARNGARRLRPTPRAEARSRAGEQPAATPEVRGLW